MRLLSWRSILTFTTCLIACPMVAAAQGVETTKLADGVYLVRTPFDGLVYGNSVVIVNDSDVVVFDTNARPSSAALVLAEIRKITSKPVRVVINSHWHNDHWTGNTLYAHEFPGVEIIASEETARIMHRMAPARAKVAADRLALHQAAFDLAVRTGKNQDGTPFTAAQRASGQAALDQEAGLAAEETTLHRVFPNVTFADRLTLTRGHREFRLFRVNGHASGETMLYLPKEKVLLAGDIIVHPIPYGTTNYSLAPWIATLSSLDTLDCAVIVPGHGPAFHDRTYINQVKALFTSIERQVDSALDAGLVSVPQVQSAVSVSTFRAQFTHGDPALQSDFDELTASLVKKAYQEALDGMEGRS